MRSRIVFVNRKAFVWTPGEGLEVDAILELHKLAHRLANKYCMPGALRGASKEDLYQAAMLGAAMAAQRYEPVKSGFLTYAIFWMRAKIFELLNSELICSRNGPWINQWGIDDMNDWGEQNEVRFQLVHEAEAETYLEKLEIRQKVREAMKSLELRDRVMLRMRFGFDQGEDLTLEEIGATYGITRERVRQREALSLGRIHKRLVRQGVTWRKMREEL